MKRITIFLSLLLTLSWATAMAQNSVTWTGKVSATSDAITDASSLTEGQTVVFKHVATGEYLYVDPHTNVLYVSDLINPGDTDENGYTGLMVFKVHPTTASDGTTTYSFESNAFSGYYIPTVNFSAQPELAISTTAATFTISTKKTDNTALDKGQFVITSTAYYGSSTSYGSFDCATDKHRFVGWEGKGDNCAYQIIPVETTNDEYKIGFDYQAYQIGTATTSPAADQWYLLYNVNRSAYAYNNSDGEFKMNGTAPNLASLSETAGYLFKLVPTGTTDKYYLYNGNGSFLTISHNGRSTVNSIYGLTESFSSGIFTVGTVDSYNYLYQGDIVDSDNNYYLLLDGQPAGSNLVGWNQTIPTSNSGNAIYQFIPVTLADGAFAGAGYYRLTNCKDNNYLTLYQSGSNYIMHDTDAPKAINSVFEFVETETAGQYNIKVQGLTLGKLNADNVPIYAWEEGTTNELGEYVVSYYNGVYIIKGTNATNSEHPYFHVNGGNLMGWVATTNASQWNFVPATDVEVALTTIGEESYATTYLPFPVSSASDAVSLYTGTLNSSESVVTMSSVESLPSETGAVIVGSAGTTTATLNILSEEPTDNTSSALTGTLLPITLSDDNRANYLVFGRSTTTNELGFYKPSSSVSTTGYNKAFIDNSSLSANAITMNFGGSQTAIEDIINGNMNNAAIYDLSGRRVMKTIKGNFYIQGGKKFIAK